MAPPRRSRHVFDDGSEMELPEALLADGGLTIEGLPVGESIDEVMRAHGLGGTAPAPPRTAPRAAPPRAPSDVRIIHTFDDGSTMELPAGFDPEGEEFVLRARRMAVERAAADEAYRAEDLGDITATPESVEETRARGRPVDPGPIAPPSVTGPITASTDGIAATPVDPLRRRPVVPYDPAPAAPVRPRTAEEEAALAAARARYGVAAGAERATAGAPGDAAPPPGPGRPVVPYDPAPPAASRPRTPEEEAALAAARARFGVERDAGVAATGTPGSAPTPPSPPPGFSGASYPVPPSTTTTVGPDGIVSTPVAPRIRPAPSRTDARITSLEVGDSEGADDGSDATLADRRAARDASAEEALADVTRRDAADAAIEETYRSHGPETTPEEFAAARARYRDSRGLTEAERFGGDGVDPSRAHLPGFWEDMAARGVPGAEFVAGLFGDEAGPPVPPDDEDGFREPTPEDYARTEEGTPAIASDIAGGPAGVRRGGGGRRGGYRAPVELPPAPPPPQAGVRGNPALDRALGRAGRTADIAELNADIEHRGYADTGAALRGAERARVDNENMRRDAMGNARERYRVAMERATAMTIDPEGWYHDRGVLGTIGAAIAVAMGSFGSGLTGGTNEALGIINASIERDLLAQENAIDQGHARAAGEANLMDMLGAEFQSRDAAVAAARAAMLEDVANRVATESSALGTEEARIAGESMHDQLISEANAAAAAAMQAEQDREIDLALRAAQAREAMATATRAERRAMGGGGGASFATPDMGMLDTADRMAARLGIPLGEAFGRLGMDPSLASGASGGVSRVLPPADRADIATLSNALDEIDVVAGTLENPVDFWTGVPGVGLMDAALPDVAVGEEGRRVRRAVINAADVLQRLRSGAAGPLAEWDRYLSLLRGSGTEDALRENVAAIRREITAILGANPVPADEAAAAAAAELGLEP